MSIPCLLFIVFYNIFSSQLKWTLPISCSQLCFRKTRVVDDGRAVVDAQQVSRRVQQPWLKIVQI